LLKRRTLRAADPTRGRFRGFLLKALQRYEINEHERATTIKRGRNHAQLALDFDNAEQTFLRGFRSDDTPERVFDRHWAMLSLERVLTALRAEYERAGRKQLADALLPYLTDGAELPPYAVVGDRLAMSEGAVRVAVHRLRRRFREILRQQVADTVHTADAVDEEMRELIRVVGA
jgi:RNA polymerase sigma-70 factor (ECF subfamily)